ncbi:MAG TPA: DUF5995 family protein [Nocardioidaceae bacterium]|nr:DUF5995 family protein [Nocardioidaceae bacterium]
MDIAAVISRMHEIDSSLPPDDGVAVFNRMYLDVTERVAASLASRQVFENFEFMTELDIRFAQRYLDAIDAPDEMKPKAWAPLFEGRDRRFAMDIQFALSGMNTHIAHDLPLAVVSTCEAMGLSPRSEAIERDYEAVTGLLAEAESAVRRSFLTECLTRVDDEVGPVVHLVSSWAIDKARDVAWVTTQTLWTLREIDLARHAFEASLALSVGMGSRLLLTPSAVSL